MKKQPPIHVPVLCRQRYEEKDLPLQQTFEKEFKKLPEFDFYQTSPEGAPPEMLSIVMAELDQFGRPLPKENLGEPSHYELYKFMLYDNGEKPTDTLFGIKKLFMQTRDEAKAHEHKNNFKEAARLYEWLVAQEYPFPYAYDRLIKIYKDHDLINEAIFTIQEAIRFFKDLKAKQTKYVGMLAEKYGVTDYFLDRILDKKKVFYYGGSFELYNPYPIIEKWEQKLEKLCKQKKALI